MLDWAHYRKTSSNCQATNQNELCFLFKKPGYFFHRVNVQIGLTPIFHPVHFCSLFKKSPAPPQRQTCLMNDPLKIFQMPRI